jgi:hypothetical protein
MTRLAAVSRAVHTILLVLLAAAPAAAQTPWERQADERLRAMATELARQGWHYAGDPFTGRLAQGERDSLRIALREGTRYALVALCDGNCRDLEISLLGETSALLAEGTVRSDRPLLEFQPGVTGKYRIVVSMAHCASGPCAYGMGVFTK